MHFYDNGVVHRFPSIWSLCGVKLVSATVCLVFLTFNRALKSVSFLLCPEPARDMQSVSVIDLEGLSFASAVNFFMIQVDC